MTEHILGMLSSMLRSLPAESAPRIRLLAKFVEKDYEKLNRTVQIRRDYASKLAAVDQDIKIERTKLPQSEQEDMADEWLSRRMDAGLYLLQVSALCEDQNHTYVQQYQQVTDNLPVPKCSCFIFFRITCILF